MTWNKLSVWLGTHTFILARLGLVTLTLGQVILVLDHAGTHCAATLCQAGLLSSVMLTHFILIRYMVVLRFPSGTIIS